MALIAVPGGSSSGRLSLGWRAWDVHLARGVDIAWDVHLARGFDIAWWSVPGDTNPPAPLPSDESNTRSFTPMIEAPETGVDYDVYLSLHCGYSDAQRVGFGGRLWRFPENGTADSMYVEGTLRLVSADSATLTVDVALVTGVLIADGTAHPLVPATDDGGCI